MELISHHQQEEFGKGPKETPRVRPPPRILCWQPSWLSNACTTRKDSESERFVRDNVESNPITMKPETASHVAGQSSWVPLPTHSPPGRPFPIKSLALSAHVSPQTIHFRVLDRSPLFRPWKGSPFLRKMVTPPGSLLC